MFTKTKISFKSLSGASLSPIKVFIFIYISKKIMAMPSVLLCEECLRPSVYLEIDFFFFYRKKSSCSFILSFLSLFLECSPPV